MPPNWFCESQCFFLENVTLSLCRMNTLLLYMTEKGCHQIPAGLLRSGCLQWDCNGQLTHPCSEALCGGTSAWHLLCCSTHTVLETVGIRLHPAQPGLREVCARKCRAFCTQFCHQPPSFLFSRLMVLHCPDAVRLKSHLCSLTAFPGVFPRVPQTHSKSSCSELGLDTETKCGGRWMKQWKKAVITPCVLQRGFQEPVVIETRWACLPLGLTPKLWKWL